MDEFLRSRFEGSLTPLSDLSEEEVENGLDQSSLTIEEEQIEDQLTPLSSSDLDEDIDVDEEGDNILADPISASEIYPTPTGLVRLMDLVQ